MRGAAVSFHLRRLGTSDEGLERGGGFGIPPPSQCLREEGVLTRRARSPGLVLSTGETEVFITHAECDHGEEREHE